MAVRIRMRRISTTSKGRYNHRIVVMDRQQARDSRQIEEIGFYSAAKNPAHLEFNAERYEYWLKKGATPSDTVASLYKRFKKNKP